MPHNTKQTWFWFFSLDSFCGLFEDTYRRPNDCLLCLLFSLSLVRQRAWKDLTLYTQVLWRHAKSKLSWRIATYVFEKNQQKTFLIASSRDATMLGNTINYFTHNLFITGNVNAVSWELRFSRQHSEIVSAVAYSLFFSCAISSPLWAQQNLSL